MIKAWRIFVPAPPFILFKLVNYLIKINSFFLVPRRNDGSNTTAGTVVAATDAAVHMFILSPWSSANRLFERRGNAGEGNCDASVMTCPLVMSTVQISNAFEAQFSTALLPIAVADVRLTLS